MEGFDYLEYKNSLRSIENVIPDEQMRYKSAFEMAKTMGLSKEKLIQSAEYYISILSTEDKKFKDALENQKAKQIQGRADQLTSIEKAIIDKQQQIEKLNLEIENAKKQLDTMKAEINDAVVKIDVTNQQFVSSFSLVHGQIAEDIEKIKRNL
jgi:peptidoglycan hydrolase CwlO-like protein